MNQERIKFGEEFQIIYCSAARPASGVCSERLPPYLFFKARQNRLDEGVVHHIDDGFPDAGSWMIQCASHVGLRCGFLLSRVIGMQTPFLQEFPDVADTSGMFESELSTMHMNLISGNPRETEHAGRIAGEASGGVANSLARKTVQRAQDPTGCPTRPRNGPPQTGSGRLSFFDAMRH